METDCSAACPGDAAESCGGTWSNSVYRSLFCTSCANGILDRTESDEAAVAPSAAEAADAPADEEAPMEQPNFYQTILNDPEILEKTFGLHHGGHGRQRGEDGHVHHAVGQA